MRLATVLPSVLAVVLVAGTAYAAQAPAPSPAAKAAASAVVLNINTATAAQLEQLPGIGPRTAALIVEYRQKHGPFKKTEELMNVKGLGEKSFLRLKDRVTVAAPKPEAS